ncbi:MAG: alpha-galactosidase [Actinobacteria bacterium]|nr:alpha-galactosidase [Actinomycetota bacterium]
MVSRALPTPRASRRSVAILAALGLLAASQGLAPKPVRAASGVSVTIAPGQIQIENEVVRRVWRDTGASFRTASLRDLRTGREWVGPAGSNDFSLSTPKPLKFTSSDFSLDSAEQAPLAGGGVRVTMHLSGPLLFSIDQIVDAYPGIAGFRQQLVVRPAAALVVSSYSLGEITTPEALRPVGQTFHSGSDWRDEEDWEPRIQIGGEDTPRAGRSDWRVQTAGPRGGPYEVNGEWISGRAEDGSGLFIVPERVNLPSSRVSLKDGRLAADAIVHKDIIGFGPIESEIHAENPTGLPIRNRVIRRAIALEPAFVGLSTSADDEAWQHTKYLRAAGWDYPLGIEFNTNTIDDDSLPSNSPDGAKDSVDQAKFFQLLPKVAGMGIETFIFDDGWQQNSGDWEPDPSRFPQGFGPVRQALEERGMRLGLWMSPMSFHPNSTAFRLHPTWACIPVGLGTGLANATPLGEVLLGGSAEAGIGVWNPNGPSQNGKMIKDLEAKITRAITHESVTRGPSWFQNGSPDPNVLLHNLWLVAPYVPTYSIGQAVASGKLSKYSVDYVMAVALPSHMTFWADPTPLTTEQVQRIRFWTDLYKGIRGELAEAVVYPSGPDPMSGNNWAALQAWNHDTQRGYLFAYRQASDAERVEIPIRGLIPSAVYRVTDVVTGAHLGEFLGSALAPGLFVKAPTRNSARVIRIERV